MQIHVKVVNKTTRKPIGEALVLKSLAAKLKGLMFSKTCTEPLLFSFSRESITGSAIHSFFCPPFEAIYLNSKRKVVDLLRVKPGIAQIKPIKPASFLLECPPGTIESTKTKIGDELTWN